MRPLSLRRALTGAFVAAGLLVGGWIGLGEMRGVASVFDPVETLTLDWRFLLAGPRMAPDGVVVVAIDDETLSDASGHALSRALMAKIVLALAASHPRVVALDFAFPDAKEGGRGACECAAGDAERRRGDRPLRRERRDRAPRRSGAGADGEADPNSLAQPRQTGASSLGALARAR